MSEEMRGLFATVVEDHEQRRAATGQLASPAKPVGWLFAAAASWLFLAWLLLSQPAIARTDIDRAFTPPTELQTASLRFGLWLAHRQVEDFRRSAARLPRYAGEAGTNDLAIMLEANGRKRYTLIGHDGKIGLRLSSEMSADSFLGNSLAALAASRPYQQAGIPGLTTAR